jgi:DNA invertase Pin-like site-specific DNA recombinase
MTTRVAIYIRVSTEEQDIKGVSIPAQEEILTKFIKDN